MMSEDYPSICSLIAEAAPGTTVSQIGWDALRLSQQLHIPVTFVHNCKEYTTALEIHEKAVSKK